MSSPSSLLNTLQGTVFAGHGQAVQWDSSHSIKCKRPQTAAVRDICNRTFRGAKRPGKKKPKAREALSVWRVTAKEQAFIRLLGFRDTRMNKTDGVPAFPVPRPLPFVFLRDRACQGAHEHQTQEPRWGVSQCPALRTEVIMERILTWWQSSSMSIQRETNGKTSCKIQITLFK